jgi:hypothetical protein
MISEAVMAQPLRPEAIKQYRCFVQAGMQTPSPREDLKARVRPWRRGVYGQIKAGIETEVHPARGAQGTAPGMQAVAKNIVSTGDTKPQRLHYATIGRIIKGSMFKRKT